MRQFVVIGLGDFGSEVARVLGEARCDVLAIDRNRDKVDKIKDTVADAVIADATDRETLQELIGTEVDTAVVSLGDRTEASIMVTLYLKELEVKKIIVKAANDDHARALLHVGATRTIFPEREMAEKLAAGLVNPNILDHLPLAEGYSLLEITVPEYFVGKNLLDLHLRQRYGIQVIAIKKGSSIQLIPSVEHVFAQDDCLVVVGPDDALEKMQEESG